MGGVERQLGGGLLPQVNEERGMDHGDSKTAHPLPFPDQGILHGPLVIALKPEREGCCYKALLFQSCSLAKAHAPSSPAEVHQGLTLSFFSVSHLERAQSSIFKQSSSQKLKTDLLPTF